MRKFLLLALVFGCFETSACELKVISPTQIVKENESFYFLFGTKDGNYIVKSWQFEKSKMWLDNGEPVLSLSAAIEKSKCYLKSKSNIGVKEVSLRSAQDKFGSEIWYYQVTLSDLPLKFGANEYVSVVLLSGEIVSLPKK